MSFSCNLLSHKLLTKIRSFKSSYHLIEDLSYLLLKDLWVKNSMHRIAENLWAKHHSFPHCLTQARRCTTQTFPFPSTLIALTKKQQSSTLQVTKIIHQPNSSPNTNWDEGDNTQTRLPIIIENYETKISKTT